jgi:2-dehydro-3-deoxyphosphogluconate aldolase/(4S)-4-hydroxy-2-oxoglutarate aldolase
MMLKAKPAFGDDDDSPSHTGLCSDFYVFKWVLTVGVLPAIKLRHSEDLLPYARALSKAGVRVVEITATTPGFLDTLKMASAEFGNDLYLGVGTVLTAETARAAIQAGARLIVNPAVIPEVIAEAHRCGAACYSGAFTATECLAAMRAGADMVKIFPAALGGPRYMLNLKMVYPEVNLIPSGGISLETAGEFIKCGACAVSGSRQFVDAEMVKQHGFEWITERTMEFIKVVEEARKSPYPLP